MADRDVGYYANGSACTYSTIAAAITAASAADRIVLYHRSASSRDLVWYISSAVTVNKAVEITGYLPKRQLLIINDTAYNANTFNFTVTGASISNLTFSSKIYTANAFLSTDTANVAYTVNNCTALGLSIVARVNGSGSVLNLNNCEAIGCIFLARVVSTNGGAINANNCTVVLGGGGFQVDGGPSGGTTIKNCVCLIGNVSGYAQVGTQFSSNCTNNASAFGTAPGTNPISITDLAGTGVMAHSSNGFYVPSGRVAGTTSSLFGAGVDAGLTADIDGQAYATGTFPIGCSIGIKPYVADFPSVGNVRITDHVDGVTGTYVPALPAYYYTGLQYGTNNTEVTGQYQPDFPLVSNVRNIDTVNGVTGTYNPHFPAVGNVVNRDTVNGVTGIYVPAKAESYYTGLQFGTNGTEVTGQYQPDFPAPANVLTADTVNGVTGLWHKADYTKYLKSSTFGVNGTSEVGTYLATADYPAEADVLLGVEYDNHNKIGILDVFPAGEQTGNLVLPTVDDVLAGIGYGSNGTEFTGTLVSTGPVSPQIQSVTPGDGQATLILTGVVGSNRVYVRYRRSVTEHWSAESLTVSRIGNGNLVITGLINYENYEFIAYSRGGSGGNSDWSKPRNAVPRRVGISKVREDIVNSMAQSALNILKMSGLGTLITFENGDDEPVDIWAGLLERRRDDIDVKGSSVNYSEVAFTIPKQVGFPPSNIIPGSLITEICSEKMYQVVRVEYSATNIFDSPSIDLYCNILGHSCV